MIPREAGQQRAYRGLLRLYPPEFRQRFSDEMVQLFSDQLRDARTGGAPIGPAVTWLKALGDVAVTAASERVRRNRTVAHSLTTAPSLSSRVLGLFGILGGLILIVVFLGVPFPGGLNVVRLSVFNLGAMAIIIGVHRRQASAAPLLAWSAAIPAFLGNASFLVMTILGTPASGPTGGLAYDIAAIVMWLGDAAFGLVALRLGAVTRWGALALAVGSVLAVTGLSRFGWTGTADAPTIFYSLALIGVALNGIGWIALGLDVAFRRRPSESRS